MDNLHLIFEHISSFNVKNINLERFVGKSGLLCVIQNFFQLLVKFKMEQAHPTHHNIRIPRSPTTPRGYVSGHYHHKSYLGIFLNYELLSQSNNCSIDWCSIHDTRLGCLTEESAGGRRSARSKTPDDLLLPQRRRQCQETQKPRLGFALLHQTLLASASVISSHSALIHAMIVNDFLGLDLRLNGTLSFHIDLGDG